MLSEFDLISNYFSKTIHRKDVAVGIGDDCALVQVPPQHQLVITTDSLVENVHFPSTTLPEHIGYKAMAVNLSDLAAMGATPAWATLALTIPAANATWLQSFASGFFQLLDRYDMQLIGGDTCRGPLTITLAAYGFVAMRQALRRSGARPGDKIYVTGTLGDAALALRQWHGELNCSASRVAYLQQKLNCPEPRIAAGLALRTIANAAIDISDGLVADLGHILTASAVGASVNIAALPLSKVVNELIKAGDITQNQAWQCALSGGDDYELCFTVPAVQETAFTKIVKTLGCAYSCIGVIEAEIGLRLRDATGSLMQIDQQGYRHFS